MAPKRSRRDFLTGRALRDTVRDALPADQPGAGPSPAPDGYLVHVTRKAMACEFQAMLNAGQYEQGLESALEALDLLELLEQQMSVFRPTSEICTINRTAYEAPVKVEPRLFEVLELAGRIHAETDGALDITAGPLWEAWGFARRAGSIPDDQQLADAMQRVGWRHVELDAQQTTIRFDAPGVGLNLGSIGKGYALDRCAEEMATSGVGDFLLHGGQSSILARGSQCAQRGGSEGEKPAGWTVGIRHPLREDRRLAEIRLVDRALGTSGSGVQFFRHQGRRLGHILDPRTGQPAEGVLSTTVLAPSAALADALATGLFVLGAPRALEFCRARPELAAVIVCPARRAGGIEVQSIGLDEDDWTPMF